MSGKRWSAERKIAWKVAQAGANNSMWKGGRLEYDYICISVGSGKYRMEQRLVMESIIGRKLTKLEKVHHIDTDKRNNAPDNLFLCASIGLHNLIHKKYNQLIKQWIPKEFLLKAIEEAKLEYAAKLRAHKLTESTARATHL